MSVLLPNNKNLTKNEKWNIFDYITPLLKKFNKKFKI